jgi:hypothetical protein
MAVTTAASAPYAPAKTILDVIDKCRHGMKSPLTAEVLARAGISDSLIPRTLQALETLDLIDPNGAATPTLETLRRSPDAEYRPRLSEWLNAAYADVLNFVDPATATENAIQDAFRSYNPLGQRPRMASLFTGLYTAAGVRQVQRPASSRSSRRIRPPGRTMVQPNQRKEPLQAPKQEREVSHTMRLHPALSGLLATLPADGGWTKARRDSFMSTFGAVLDYCVPITEPAQPNASDNL